MSDNPTSPLTASEIEAMFGDEARAAEWRAPAADMVGEWRRLAQFVARPALPAQTGSAAPLRVLGRIYVLDLLAMLALVLLASVAVAAGMYIPAPAIAGIEFDALVILGVIAVAPVLEELVFRSWLSGRPGHGLAVLALAAGGIGFALLHTGAMVVSLAVLAAGLLTAIAAPVVLRGAPPMRWFAHGFAVFYWLSVLAFALVHLTNFSSGTILVLLPLVLPQFVLGILLGYVRVRIGLWGAMLLHGLHNASALALAGMVMAATG